MTTPATRSLPAVLRALVEHGAGLRLVAAVYASSQPADLRYVTVVINGETLTVPNLNAAPPFPGQVAYLLTDDTRMFCLGTVRGA